MSTPLFLAAGALAALWLAVHCSLGGRQIARPLLAATSLDPVIRQTHYLCWHFTTLSLTAMAGFFLWAAFTGITAYASAATFLAAGFTAVGIGLARALHAPARLLPQGWLFLPVALLGLAGHL